VNRLHDDERAVRPALARGGWTGRSPLIPAAIVWLIVALCCTLPLVWMVVQIALNPTTLAELHLDAFRLRLLGRTILYNFTVAVIATALALPAALVMGRGRGWLASVLAFALPVSLLLPSLAFAYGWSQFFRLVNVPLEPAGWGDVFRCIWSLATWLWPLPAMVMGIALRRADTEVQQQALLDGVLGRTILRQLAGPAVASACIVAVLAVQEFAVYEPTGISVVATEVRMVFETGAYSSPSNPIVQPMTGSGAAASYPDQRARAAAAVATSLPLLAIVAALVLIATLGARKLSIAEHVETGAWPRSLDARFGWVVLSWLLVGVTTVLPLASMVLALKRPFALARVWNEFGPQATGSLLVASVTGIAALVLALMTSAGRSRGATALALVSFLIGGQLVAIAMIRLYNRPWLGWVYNAMPLVVMAYVARFGWVALVAGNATWGGAGWRALRDMAAVDGATAFQAARKIVWPLAWPILGAGAAFVMILSLSEVPATVLLAPQRPQVLVPMLMTWVHLQRSDVMIEASLLLGLMVAVLAIGAMLLIRLGLRLAPVAPASTPRQSESASAAPDPSALEPPGDLGRRFADSALSRRRGGGAVLLAVVTWSFTGCSGGNRPDDVWCETGTGPAQTVYPRGIAYSASDDTSFIVDRQARIQHLDRHGKFLGEWHTPESQQGKPVGLTVGPDGNLWVPDTHYHRVLVYAPDGRLLRQFGARGTGPGQFIYPTDVAFGPDGRVFVSEYGDHDRVQVFDMDGNYKYEFGEFGEGDGQFSRPQSMVVYRDEIYITDACNHRLVVFTTGGKFLRNIGGVGSDPGQFRFPYGLDVDADGNLIVCEFGNNRVQKIDPKSGNGLAVWGAPGRDIGQLAYPWGVAVDKRDRVVTVDAGNNRLQVFQF
jgi:ABC-type Fe3+ transport system permease subunit/DNA-binding beta-propeller fold protein YncE